MEIRELMKKKLDQGREYRSMTMAPAEEDKTVEGYATTFEQKYDLYSYEDKNGRHTVREVVSRDAFKEAEPVELPEIKVAENKAEKHVSKKIGNEKRG